MKLKNPILTGFHADPCICRKGDDYYIAVSSFEWFPGIPIYHSRDMKHWELYAHVLTDEKACDLTRLPSAKGIWASCLTYCEDEDLFYVVYGVMNSMNARYFDVDNFVVTAKDVRGSWSAPVYLHSAGFQSRGRLRGWGLKAAAPKVTFAQRGFARMRNDPQST